MINPKVVIIDDEPAIRKLVENAFKSKIKKETGIEFEVKSYEKCPENIEEIDDATLYLIDYFLPGKKGDKIAKELKERGARGGRVLFTGSFNEAIQEITGASASGLLSRFSKDRESEAISAWYETGGNDLFHRVISKGKKLETEKLISLINELRKEKKIKAPLNLGVIGLGRLGRETIERASETHWIKQINIFSEFFNKHESQAYKMYSKVIGAVNTHNKLETLLDTNPDVLFIATGKKSDKIIAREKMFEESAEKIYPVLKAIREANYKNLIVMGSNPIEPLIKLAHEIGIDPRQIVGENVTDTLRTRRMLAEGEYIDEKVQDIYHIDVEVLGTHSRPIPILSNATINGKQIKNYKEFREQFTEELRGIGKKIMIGAETIGSYSDAPNAVMEMLWDISTFSERPRSCWTTYNDQTGFYVTSHPIKIRYNRNITVAPKKIPELDSWEKEELKKQEKQFNIQRNTVKKFLKRK